MNTQHTSEYNSNAVAILTQELQQSTISVRSHRIPPGIGGDQTYEIPRKKKHRDIAIPFLQFANTPELYRAITTKAAELLTAITGQLVVFNWVDRISCVCDAWDVQEITQCVKMEVYKMLCEMKVPVIWGGGDVAGFGPETDCMEDGTTRSIFQYQACKQFGAPNPINEIWAAIQYPEFNYFVAISRYKILWGSISAFNPMDGSVTITPLNPRYSPATVRLRDMLNFYRVERLGTSIFQMVNGDEKEALKASMQRAALVFPQ